jgi:hypothetical protein
MAGKPGHLRIDPSCGFRRPGWYFAIYQFRFEQQAQEQGPPRGMPDDENNGIKKPTPLPGWV